MSQDKLLLYLVAFISLIGLFSFLASPYFQIHDIAFQGLDAVGQPELKEILESYYHSNILLVDSRKIRARLSNISYIKEAEVSKKYPDQLQITVKERIPLAKINNNGSYITFSGTGYILEEGALKSRLKIPEITGTGYTLSNHRINFSSDLEKVVESLGKLDSASRAMLSMIEIQGDKLSITLGSQAPVYLGPEDNLVEKFKILQSVLKKIRQEGLSIEYIDLTIPEKPVIKLKG